MKSSLSYPRRTIQTNGNVLWPHKLTSNLSNDNEHNIPKGSIARLALSIHGQHYNSHKMRKDRNRRTTRRKAPKVHTPCLRQTRETWPVPQTQEMQIQKRRNQIPESNHRIEQNMNGPRQAWKHSRLASTVKPYRSSAIFRIYGILSVFCTQLLKNCMTTVKSHQNEPTLAMERALA
jgi:hypothetical protein